MPTLKGRGEGPGYGNPPSLRDCFTVEGLGAVSIHVSEEGGFVSLRQGHAEVRFPADCSPALRAALERLEGTKTYLVYDRPVRKGAA